MTCVSEWITVGFSILSQWPANCVGKDSEINSWIPLNLKTAAFIKLVVVHNFRSRSLARNIPKFENLTARDKTGMRMLLLDNLYEVWLVKHSQEMVNYWLDCYWHLESSGKPPTEDVTPVTSDLSLVNIATSPLQQFGQGERILKTVGLISMTF